jgi:anti-sigma factor RsiW
MMHRVVEENLEAYLGGTLKAEETRRIEDHLDSCESCRNSVKDMRGQSALFRGLRSFEDIEPDPGFYARVMDRIESQKRLSIWSALLEPVFAKRLAVVSLVLLLLLGAMVASVEQEPVQVANDGSDPVERFVQPPPLPDFGNDPQRDRDVILVNLASYQSDPATY